MLRDQVGSFTELCSPVTQLRRQIFVVEQGIPEDEVFDELDDSASQLVIFENQTPVATARIRESKDGWHIGWVAVEKSRRGQHLGLRIMRLVLEQVRAQSGRVVHLSAQQEVVRFYERLGFTPSGAAEELESGFVLVPMKLELTQVGKPHETASGCRYGQDS